MNEQATELLPPVEPGAACRKALPVQRSSVLVQILAMRKDLVGHLMALEKIHGPAWKIAIGRGGMISLLGPDALEFVWKNRDGAFSSARGWEPYIGKVFPGAIMAMDGDQHRYQRRIMQVAFRKPALRTYLEQMSPAIDLGLSGWMRPNGASAERQMFPLLKQLTLDLAASVFMGVELGHRAKDLNRAFMATVAASLALIRMPVPGFSMWRGIRGRELLVKRFRELLPQKRAAHTNDFFSEFCHAQSELGERFTDQEIIDHMIFLMMAAHDTTTSTLTTMMYLLARHPEWQERLRAKALALGRRQLEFDDLDQVEELSWTMREALRLTPPLTSMPRMCVKDTVFQGFEIPAGMLVGVYPIHVHYMDSLWTEPFKFDPERFSPERQEDKHHAFAWVPFGGGAHMCIGQHFATLQVKAIMHQLLLRYRWSIAPGYIMPQQLVPIAKPKDGLQVTLRRMAA
ncbi:MAG TPA: cytochrome P450 [Steroidobacteraceae bacterium]|nr:cytochrome P450 [Steroidobacteraceae bacterium]